VPHPVEADARWAYVLSGKQCAAEQGA